MTSAPQTPSRSLRPFSRVLEKFPDIPVQSCFSGLFHEFEEPAARQVTWDLPTYIERSEKAGARSVLDAGYGSGRVISASARQFPDIHLTGIDNAGGSEALSRAPYRTGAVRRGGPPRLRCLAEKRGRPRPAGQVTLNAFASASAAREVVRNLRDAVRPSGHVGVVACGESSLECSVHLRERCDAVPFQGGRGVRRII